MKKIDPSQLVRYVMLATTTDGKARCVYRSNAGIPKALWGKTVPSISVNERRYILFANYIAEVEAHIDFLIATAHIPATTPDSAEELRSSHWLSTPKLRSDYQFRQTYLQRPGTASEQQSMKDIRDLCIRQKFNTLKERKPDTSDSELVCDIAALFQVGVPLVRRAVGLRKTGTRDALGMSPIGDVRTDPRYAVMQKAIANTRVKALKLGIHCKFGIRDVLKYRNGVYYLPSVCPVLGVPLDYSTKKHDTYIRNPYSVRVWRRSKMHRLDSVNTVAMSAIAMHMIEDTDKNAEARAALVRDYPGALERFEEWAGRYGV